MVVLSMNKVGTDRQINPTELLKQISESSFSGRLKISHKDVQYLIYFRDGNLNYANHSIDPFERLDLHLRRLSHSNSNITSAVRSQTRLEFEHPEQAHKDQIPQDYQAIHWLIEQKHLSVEEGKNLVKFLTEEVLETYLLSKDYTYELKTELSILRPLCNLKTSTILEERLTHLHRWGSLSPAIVSPYQRPYCQTVALLQQALPETYQKLAKVLIGFSFRQMAVLLKQDELKLAQSLYPLILKKAIQLKEPQAPFDKLPKFDQATLPPAKTFTQTLKPFQQPSSPLRGVEIIDTAHLTQKTARIACVDDSPTMLKEINRFLDGNNFEVFTITDSVKALIEIMRIKPDLILLDVGMPTVDGYQLCRLIRNSSLFKSTPIVMVTGNNTLIDRAKARVSGATDYLAKPFTQAELLKIVFRYLT